MGYWNHKSTRPMQHNLLEESGQGSTAARIEVLVMYAVIRTGGKQYLVSHGEQLKIENTAHQDGKMVLRRHPRQHRRGQVRVRPHRSQGPRLRRRRRPRRQDPRLQAQAQEAVQEDAGTPPELRRGQDQRDSRQWEELQGIEKASQQKVFSFCLSVFQDHRKGPERPRERGNRNGT